MPLEQARGRVLAEDLAARLTQPPFDASAMDGYAVRGRGCGYAAGDAQADRRVAPPDAASTARLRPAKPCASSPARRCPKGADTVVIQENTDDAARRGHRQGGGAAAAISGRAARTSPKARCCLRAGTRLGPRELMLAAAMNHAELPVRRKPKVAILATGDEVVPPGTELGRDQIVSSVPSGLAALIEAQGGEPMSLGIAKDTAESLVTLARTGSAADILVTIGGASVGERDLVGARAPLRRARARLLEDRHAAGQAAALWPLGHSARAWAAGQPGLGA